MQMMANIIGRYKYQVRKFNYLYILQKGKGEHSLSPSLPSSKNRADNLCHHLHSQSLKVRKTRLNDKSEKVFSELRSTVSSVFIEVQLA